MSAWDSKRTAKIHRWLRPKQIRFNEMMKETSCDWNKAPRKIIRNSDVSLIGLLEVDPGVIGAGGFRAFIKDKRIIKS